MIRAAIFDLGGVLIEEPKWSMVSYFAKFFHVSENDFRQALAPLDKPFKKGEISENDFWKKIKQQLHVPDNNKNPKWLDGFLPNYQPNKEVFAIVDNLHSIGIKTALLSNTEMPISDFITKQHFSDFDYFNFSCKMHQLKPHKDIFMFMLAEIYVKPEEVIFVDDTRENIDGAEKIGIHGILFKNAKQLKKNLQTFNLLV